VNIAPKVVNIGVAILLQVDYFCFVLPCELFLGNCILVN
jgi:hypothetical protein